VSTPGGNAPFGGLLRAALVLLLAALAVRGAVRLIEQVWVPLAIIAAVAAAIWALVAWLRSRRGGW